MKGYVRNNTPVWRHALKRSIGPGQKVSLEELYEQYGLKHELPDGPEFVEWLKQVKLRDSRVWQVVLEEDPVEVIQEVPPVSEAQDSPANVVSAPEQQVRPFVVVATTIDDIVGLSVRKAKEALQEINDYKLLKQSLAVANTLANKNSLCILLRRRLQEVQLIRG